MLICVVDSGSITAAARAHGTSPSVISRAISRLEARLAVPLLRRTTRSMSLTDAGMAYVARMREAIELIAEAENEVRGLASKVSGHVRITAPTTYGHFRLPRLLRSFSEHHPLVELEINITNRNVDLVAEGLDMAIRLGDPPNSSFVGRCLEHAPVSFAAAPSYLENMGTPSTIAELDEHRCIGFVMPSSGKLIPWMFDSDGAPLEFMPKSDIRICQDVLGVVSMAAAGMGICQLYDFVLEEKFARGELVRILEHFGGRSRPFTLIYPPHRTLSLAARSLVQHLIGVARTERRPAPG